MPPKLLLVEDDPGYEAIVRRVLGPFVTKIHAAATLQEARGELARNTFDVIMLDLGLPDSPHPQETALQIPKIKASQPGAVMLVVTGSDYMREMCLRLGADHFLSKNASAQHRALVTGLHVAMESKGTSVLQNAEMVARFAEA